MSQKERKRMTVMAGVKRRSFDAGAGGGTDGLGLSAEPSAFGGGIRPKAMRAWCIGCGASQGLRRKPAALRAQVLARYAEERYADFGPTLLAEDLAKEGIVVDHDTVRRWLLAAGQHTVRRRKQLHREWRERKPCFGAMVQLDGSHHDWFEGRRAKCVLMVMVDDATNHMRARFSRRETTRASYEVFDGWVTQTRVAGQPVCGSGQHLPVRRGGERGRTTGRKRTANAVWAGDGSVGGGTDPGQQPASQRAGGTDERRAARPAGQGPAAGRGSTIWKARTGFWSGLISGSSTGGLRGWRPARWTRIRLRPELDEVLSWEEERVVQRDWTVACEGNPAGRGGEEAAAREAADEGENRESSVREPSMAARWSGLGAAVLERDKSKRSRGAAGAGRR